MEKNYFEVMDENYLKNATKIARDIKKAKANPKAVRENRRRIDEFLKNRDKH